MTPKTKLITLCSVFVVLLATYIVGSLGVSRASRSSVAGEPLVAAAQVSEARAIRLSGRRAAAGAGEADAATVLREGADGEWSVRIGEGLFPADAERVEDFLKALGALRSVRVAARGEEYFEDFGVDEEAARVAVLFDERDEEIARLFFGDAAAGGGRMYARIDGAGEVRIVDGDIGSYFGRQPPYWSDLRPLPDDLSARGITRLSVDADLRIDADTRIVDSFTVFREAAAGASSWRLETGDGNLPEELSGNAVEVWAGRVAALEAAAFVPDSSVDPGLAEPQAELVFEDENGRTFQLRIGEPAGEARYYMRLEGPGVDTAADGEPYLYAVGVRQVRQVLRNRDALVASADNN
ncbi:MAG: DUF4340 domain-containing protein [Spirochaetes bacterium]|jgi:hypothetical protein|nr:DUF4340 domain-containing protein [Spirochaetota bacterium]